MAISKLLGVRKVRMYQDFRAKKLSKKQMGKVEPSPPVSVGYLEIWHVAVEMGLDPDIFSDETEMAIRAQFREEIKADWKDAMKRAIEVVLSTNDRKGDRK